MDYKQFIRRVWGVIVTLVLMLTILCSNLYSLQYTNGADYAAQAVAKIAERQIVEAERGAILDRNGTVLVSNQISYQVTLNTQLLGTGRERTNRLATLIQVAQEEGVNWTDTLPITKSPPFAYTTPDPFYTTQVDDQGQATRTLTRLGQLAVYQKWISDPTKGNPEHSEEKKKDSLWKQILISLGIGEEEIVPRTTQTSPVQLPTAEELLGMICRAFVIQGEGAVSESEARASGAPIPTINVGNMPLEMARAVAGLMYELNYRTRINSWPPYIFAEDVDIDFISRVKEMGLPGIEIETVSVRRYNTPYAAHLLGRVGPIFKEEWPYYQELGNYTMNDTVGKEGAEQAFESYLRGIPGQRTIERNENGKIVSSTWLTDEQGQLMLPKPGNNVFLTIDIDLQQAVEEILARNVAALESQTAQGAACVVLDVHSGQVLASASYPTFSLEHYSEQYPQYLEDPLKPLYNRALMGQYPPASTFKMITAMAALEEGIITPNTRIRDEGIYTYWPTPQPMCWIYRQRKGTHGSINVSDAIEVSCNYFFYDVGRRMGIETLNRYASMFGLGKKTGVELPEKAGVLASPEYSKQVGQRWYEGNILSVAIGQENTQVTPIQLANYIATLVNGGTRYTTHLLNSVKSGDFSQVIYNQEPTVESTIQIDQENLQAVKAGMLSLTTEGSVARYFRNIPVKVGAKTGSAQVSLQTNSNAVFVCYAPFDDPQIAVAIAVERGGSGSELGAMAAEILEYYFTPQGSQGMIPRENMLLP